MCRRGGKCRRLCVHDLAVQSPEQVVVGVLVAEVKLPVVPVHPASSITSQKAAGDGLGHTHHSNCSDSVGGVGKSRGATGSSDR